ISSDVAELKDMVRALLLDNKNQSSAPAPSPTPAPVKEVESNCVTCGGTHSYQNCLATSKNVYQDNIHEHVSQAAITNYNQGNTGFRPQMVANQTRPPEFPPVQNNQNNFNQGNNFTQNRGVLRNIQSQGERTQNQYQTVQNQLANLTDMMSKFMSSNMASSSRSGTLPGNTVTNPKEDLKGITTRSGVAYQGPTIPTPSKVIKQGTEVTKDQVQTPSSQSTTQVQPPVTQSETLVSEPIAAPVSASMPNLKPSIPYPSRRDNKRRPLIGNKEKLSEMARTPMNEHCSVVIVNKLPKKLGDPGKFLIPCEFPGMDECLALADLGASINLMPLSVWKELALPELTLTCMTLELADGSVSKPIADFVVVDFEPDPRVPLILGRCFLKTGCALIDVHKAIINSDPAPSLPNHEQSAPSFTNELKACEAKTIKSSIDEPPEVELKDLPPHIEYAFLEGDNKLPVIIAKELGDEEKAALIKVSPVHCVPKKGGFTVVKNEENELIPTRLVTGWWVCIDYRKLNEATRKDHFPLSFMDQMLERLAGNEYYCFLDGFSGYFQIPIDPRDQEKTTFTCPYETFAYRRMPFGLCNAPGTFQRCMLAIFHDMVGKTMEVFMDDFSVFGNSFETCLSRLDKMLQRCEDTKLCLNWEKSHFMVKEGIVLGHKISRNGIEVDKAKVNVITKLPYPTTVKDKLEDALWAFRTAYKTPIECTPYKLVYGKACHLPMELEHKAYWALKQTNFDLTVAGDHQKIQLNELNKLHDQAYENSLIYKEKTKRLHDSKIKNRVFNVGDRVLLFNSRWKIFSVKLKTSWSGPFTIAKVFPYGTVELSQADGPNFKVNGRRIKHYFEGDVPQLVVPDLQTFPL
nr:reverse transcriptase domain-containing protein [Tanacetum cinerariifolium]